MNRFLVTIAFLLTFASDNVMAQTTGFAEWQLRAVSSEKSVTTMDVQLVKPLGNGWTLESWSLKTDGWAETQLGVGKNLAPWVSVSASIGIEQSDNLWRTGYSLWMEKGKNTILVLYEYGDSGAWHKIVAAHEVSPKIRVGVMSLAGLGTGPYAERKFGPVKIWVTTPVVGMDKREPKVQCGLPASF